MIFVAPFDDISNVAVKLPLTLDLSTGHDPDVLLSPGRAHRRALPGRFLEFGSLFEAGFRYSWMTVGNLKLRHSRVRARLGFSRLGKPAADQPWLGIMLRGQSFWANHGHLMHFRADGSIWVTLERDTGHDNEQIGKVDGFNPATDDLDFDITMDAKAWRIQVGAVTWARSISDLPHVFWDGKIIIQTYCAWLALKSLTVEEIQWMA